MWSGPRSISTALMRSFENRSDTFVSDEPFYAHYLNETGENHPLCKKVILQGETRWDIVVKNIAGDIPQGKRVWYQKHMAQHNLPGKDLGWIKKMKNILLIRHPREVILSYIKKYEITSINQLGFHQLYNLFIMLEKCSKTFPLIIDARDVLINPKKMMKHLCNKLNIDFCKEMLSWPAGKRESDGVWGNCWYGNVEATTGFQPYFKNNNILPEKYQEIFIECNEIYQQLYQHRIR